MAGKNSTKVVTGKVRLSYVHLFEKYAADEDQEAKFSCVILVPKKDKKTIRAIEAAQQAAIENGKTSRWDGKIPKNLKNTFRDGDEEGDLEKNPEYEGHMFMNVSAKTKPGIVDRDLDPIMDSSQIYSGCYARVSINAFPYSVKGNKGVSFGLNNVQFLEDGEPLGGRSRAEDDFEALDEIEDDEDDELI